jgi:hypothetical protein
VIPQTLFVGTLVTKSVIDKYDSLKKPQSSTESEVEGHGEVDLGRVKGGASGKTSSKRLLEEEFAHSSESKRESQGKMSLYTEDIYVGIEIMVKLTAKIVLDEGYPTLTLSKTTLPPIASVTDVPKLASPKINHWLKIELPTPMLHRGLAERLVIRFNVIPLVNRRFCVQKEMILKNTIKCLRVQPQEPFAGLHAVRMDNSDKSLTFRPFAQFRENMEPTYTVRTGGMGSRDNYTAWKRLLYLLELLRTEQQWEWIQNAGLAFSLEEMHQLLHKKLITNPVTTNSTDFESLYILIHSGSSSRTALNVCAEYWTSQGESANRILAGTRLTTRDARLDEESLVLITPTQGGTDAPSETTRLEHLRGLLLRRDRLATQADIQSFCKQELGNQILQVKVSSSIGLDPTLGNCMTRLTEVILTPNPIAKVENWEAVCLALQESLAAQTYSTVPFKVILN